MPATLALSLLTLAASPGWIHGAPPAELGAVLPADLPAHLAISLRVQNEVGLRQLLSALQDPESPEFHQWLTPEEFGARFGAPLDVYDRAAAWLSTAGFEVERWPNQIYLGATGTVGDVRRLLGIEPREAIEEGRQFRSFSGSPRLPEALAPWILEIAGLDTRIHLRHYIQGSNGPTLGADDLRNFYDSSSLLSSGHGANGLVTAVIGTQEQSGPPNAQDVAYYYQNVSNATAKYTPDSLPNPNGDYDQQGANMEYELDVQMHSVGAPNASAINLVLSPASEVFTTGLNYAASTLSNAVVVSISLGICESNFQGSTQATEQYVQQGLSEGQTWFAASGDSGADDCQGGQGASVDLPAAFPEIVAMGGSMMQGSPNFDQNGAIGQYQAEAAWNESSAGGGAGGGGVSTLFTKPSWQTGSTPSDQMRDVPDLALMAAESPGVGVDSSSPGQLDPVGGTSVASPLAAGFFAALSERIGSRLGDIHSIIYKLGQAQQQSGTGPFHDITTGNNSFNGVQGESAGPGYDLVTGWGTLDVAALVTAWPSGSGSTSGGSSSSSSSGGSSSGSSGTPTTSSGSSGSVGTSGSSGNTGVSSSSGGSSTGAGGSSGSGSSAGPGSGSTSGSGFGGSGGGSSSSGSSSSSTSSGGLGGFGGSGSSTSSGSSGGQPVASGSSSGGSDSAPISDATPTPIPGTAQGQGCSTGPGGAAGFAWLLGLLALASRRRKA